MGIYTKVPFNTYLMKYKGILFLTVLLTFNYSYSQKTKKAVKLEAISLIYDGELKKGLANGNGEAKGNEDTYKGEFKKGYPHGEGTYTWGNGNIYVGEFSKGKMDGKGKLINASLKIAQEGYFKGNEYIGIHKDPYEIITDGGARSINFQKKGGNLNQITFELFSNGVPISSGVLNIRDNNNTLIETVNGYKTLTNANFPLERIEVSFSVDKATYQIIFNMYQQGNWHVIISV